MFVILGALFLLCCPMLIFAQISDKEKEEGFVPLFNGKDLDQWEGDSNLWSVKDGVIIGQTGNEGPTKLSYNSFLIWKGEPVADFVLRFDIKLSPGGNSGMQYRSWVVDDKDRPYRVNGYQADFDGNHAHSGILYAEGFGGILCNRGEETVVEENRKPRQVRQFAENNDLKKEIKTDDWNSYEITAKGFTFTNKINDHVMSICTDEDKAARKAEGILAIQAHVGPAMKVEIKNLRIKRMK